MFPTLYELTQALADATAAMAESDVETEPWDFNNGDPIPWVDTLAEYEENLAMDARIVANGGSLFGNIFGEPAPRGTTRVWADMADSASGSEPEQETAAQRNARRLEELRTMSLQDIVVLDTFTFQAMNMETDGNTEVGEVHRYAAAHFGLDARSFILAYRGQFLTNSMDITTITQDDLAAGAMEAFHVIRRPLFIHIEFRTVEHGTIRLSAHLTDSVASLYARIGFLTGWPLTAFTLRHENHTLDDWVVDVAGLGISGDTFMVMVGSLAGGTQRFHIGSPCAAAASRLDESDISDMDLETESSTSMPDMARLAVAIPMTSSMQLPLTPPPSVRVGICPPHALSSSSAASGSAGVGSSAAAPPWVPSDSVSTLSVQGLKRTYTDVQDVAPGWAVQRPATASSLNL
jgi:hypothetical protein